MLKLKTIKLLILVFTFSLFVFSLKAVLAQETQTSGINLSLSPTYISLTTDPGKPVTGQFRVTNNNTSAEDLSLKLIKFQPDTAGRNPVVADIGKEDEFAGWIEYSPSEFTLNPSESRTIRFTISPPESASLGYYYGFLVGRESEAEGVEGGQAKIVGSVALPILLDVKSPNAKRELQITEFKTDKLFYEYLPTNLQLLVNNTGNVHVIPFGNVFIDSMLNQEIAVLEINPGRGNIIPNSLRQFNVIWDDGFAVTVPKEENGAVVLNDKGETEYETKFDFSKTDKFRFGRYSANLLMVYDNGERDIPVEAKVSFWIFPWKIVGGASLIVILALVGVVAIFRPVFKKLKT